MDDALAQIAGGLYKATDAVKISTWVELVSTLLVFDPDHATELKDATIELGRQTAAQYPQLESGEAVTLDLPEGLVGVFPDPAPTAYMVVTGEALFACADGPSAGAAVLCDAIDGLHDSITEGGEK